MSKQQYYQVGVSGNANYTPKQYGEIFAKLLSKGFFKKFPLAAKAFPRFLTEINNGSHGSMTLSHKALAVLRGINSKLLSKGRTPLLNIYGVMPLGKDRKAQDPWLFRFDSDTRYDHSCNIYGYIKRANGRWSCLFEASVDDLLDENIAEAFASRINFVDSVLYHDQIQELIKLRGEVVLTSVLDDDEEVFINANGIWDDEEEAEDNNDD